MSFSIEFYSATKKHAAERLGRETALPGSARDFLSHAIAALKVADEEHPRVILVKANGHLAEGPGSWSQSTASIEVREIALAI